MSDDITRLRNEYAKRKHRLLENDVYSVFNKPTTFAIQQRQRLTLNILKKYGFNHLSDLSILEMGCGSGRVLTEFLFFGVFPEKLNGVDLLFDRLLCAKHILPGSGFANADGQFLPFSSASFDLVLQYTAISSILDQEIRCNICSDMLRVIKPGGMIISYDFWLNPTNKETRGIRPAEIRQLFPHCTFEFLRTTLAPPLARRIVPISWTLAMILEKLDIFKSHYLVAIRPI